MACALAAVDFDTYHLLPKSIELCTKTCTNFGGIHTPDLHRVKTWFELGSMVQERAAAAISQEPDRNTAVPA